MDGDGKSELVVQTATLQNMSGGYWQLRELYIFCRGQGEPCLKATFRDPPIIETVGADGLRREINVRNAASRPLVDPPLDLGLLRIGRGYSISIISAKGRSPRRLDLYRWDEASDAMHLTRQCR